jgi:GDP-L-fucose synthase
MPTNLYGPGDNYDSLNSHVMASLIKKFYTASIHKHPEVICWGTGTPLREFLHVDDLGNAAVFALENWNTFSKDAPLDQNGEPLSLLNVGTGRDISIKELAKKISNILDYKGEIIWDKSKPDGTPKKQLNIKHLLKLGWEPKITLEEGIRRTLEDFPKEN